MWLYTHVVKDLEQKVLPTLPDRFLPGETIWGRGGLEKPNHPAQEKGFWITFSASTTLAGSGLNKPPRWSMCMDRKRSVCRLASQTQLLTVCLTPPTPTLPVLSNVSSRTECETTEIKVASAALDNSDSTQSQNKGLFGSCLDWSCCPGCRQAAPAAQSQKSDRWKQHMEAGGPPSILLLERHWPQQ